MTSDDLLGTVKRALFFYGADAEWPALGDGTLVGQGDTARWLRALVARCEQAERDLAAAHAETARLEKRLAVADVDRALLSVEAAQLLDEDRAIVEKAKGICHRHGITVNADTEGWTSAALRGLEAEVARLREERGILKIRENTLYETEAELLVLRQRLAEIRELLAPVCDEETIEGAIRNLQQALLSEQGNVQTLEQRHAEMEREMAIMRLAVPLEEDLSAKIDEALKCLHMEQGFTLNGLARLLIDCQRRMADDWVVIGRERGERHDARAEVERVSDLLALEIVKSGRALTERDRALDGLAAARAEAERLAAEVEVERTMRVTAEAEVARLQIKLDAVRDRLGLEGGADGHPSV